MTTEADGAPQGPAPIPVRKAPWGLITDTLTFLTGLAGIIHQEFLTTIERPALLVLFAGMIGLPGAKHIDRLGQLWRRR